MSNARMAFKSDIAPTGHRQSMGAWLGLGIGSETRVHRTPEQITWRFWALALAFLSLALAATHVWFDCGVSPSPDQVSIPIGPDADPRRPSAPNRDGLDNIRLTEAQPNLFQREGK